MRAVHRDDRGMTAGMVYIVRADGKTASVELPGVDDVWDEIARCYPLSVDYLDDGSVFVDCDPPYDDEFEFTGDWLITLWLMEGRYDPKLLDGWFRRDLPCGATLEADWYAGDYGIAEVSWTEPDGTYSQSIALGGDEGDYIRLVLGDDPVALGWTDRDGRTVCRENATKVR